MKRKFKIAKDPWGFAHGIMYGRKWMIHLQTGTELNERNIKWLVRRLNGADEEPPTEPQRKEP